MEEQSIPAPSEATGGNSSAGNLLEETAVVACVLHGVGGGVGGDVDGGAVDNLDTRRNYR